MSKEDRIHHYQKNYLSQYGFEKVMVKYRRQMLLDRLAAVKPKTVVEVGCGAELVYQYHMQNDGPADRWIIVEPGNEFYDIASGSGLPNLVAIQGFFEDSLHHIKERLPKAPDMIIISGVLHEVAKPKELIKAALSLMDHGSILHVNVPNANSLHRLLAKSMGLIQDVKTLSERNLELLQHRVYDRISLRADIEACGLTIVNEGGYLAKPFTHAQMEKITPILGEPVLDGLYQLGKDYPELASEIYLEARKR